MSTCISLVPKSALRFNESIPISNDRGALRDYEPNQARGERIWAGRCRSIWVRFGVKADTTAMAWSLIVSLQLPYEDAR